MDSEPFPSPGTIAARNMAAFAPMRRPIKVFLKTCGSWIGIVRYMARPLMKNIEGDRGTSPSTTDWCEPRVAGITSRCIRIKGRYGQRRRYPARGGSGEAAALGE